MAGADEHGRATVEKVYQLVGEAKSELGERIDKVRDDLGDRIDALSSNVAVLATSNEHRVTVLETLVGRHDADLADHEARIGSLETTHATARGHLSALKWLAATLGTLSAGLVADLVVRAAGG